MQSGQCGNQVGLQYWSQLATEHGLQSDGTPLPYENNDIHFQTNNKRYGSDTSLKYNRTDNPTPFYSVSDREKYTPRSILIDLEPSVIQKATNALPMFNPRNVHLSENGTGAANNWQHGYTYGREHEEELLNLIDREVDKCDNLSAFQLFHSVAGGTGSGVGSLLLQLLNDRYGSKKVISTFSVFPSNEKTSDVVVQPYNTVLTLQRLIDYSDATFVFDNDSLNSLETAMLGSQLERGLGSNVAFEGANKLILSIAAGVTNPLRFPSYMYSSYESIISSVVPTPTLKFLSSSIAPYSYIPGVPKRANYVSLNSYDIVLELLNDKNKMNYVRETPTYISVLDYVVGQNLNQQDIRKGVIRAQLRLQFVPWTSSSVHVVNGRQLTFVNHEGLSGYQISNNTSIVHMFSKIIKQYDLLAKRAAYINFYTETNDPGERMQVLDAFNECKESVLSVVDEYKASTSASYLEDDILDEDMDI